MSLLACLEGPCSNFRTRVENVAPISHFRSACDDSSYLISNLRHLIPQLCGVQFSGDLYSTSERFDSIQCVLAL